MTTPLAEQAQTLSYRIATPDDHALVERVLARSYATLLAKDYSRKELASMLPVMTRAQADLLASGSYWLALDAGEVVAVGGWTHAAPGTGALEAGLGHVRHVATDPAHVRRGLARALMQQAMAQAAGQGVLRLRCLATRTAVPFYASLGFEARGQIHVPMGDGEFPSVVMMREI